jgi:hypothetical protein
LYRRRFARHAPHLPAIDFRTICILTPVCSHQPLPLHSLRVHFKHAALVKLRKAGIGCSVPRKRCRDHVACRPLWAPSETVTLHIRVPVCDLLSRLRTPAATNVSIFATGINV